MLALLRARHEYRIARLPGDLPARHKPPPRRRRLGQSLSKPNAPTSSDFCRRAALPTNRVGASNASSTWRKQASPGKKEGGADPPIVEPTARNWITCRTPAGAGSPSPPRRLPACLRRAGKISLMVRSASRSHEALANTGLKLRLEIIRSSRRAPAGSICSIRESRQGRDRRRRRPA